MIEKQSVFGRYLQIQCSIRPTFPLEYSSTIYTLSAATSIPSTTRFTQNRASHYSMSTSTTTSTPTSTLDSDFASAAAFASTLGSLPKATQQAIYGTYKCATVGAPTSSRPGVFDPVGRAKWDGWTDKCKQLDTKEKAKAAYIALIVDLSKGSLVPTTSTSSSSSSTATSPPPTKCWGSKLAHGDPRRSYWLEPDV